MNWLNYHHLLYFWATAKHGTITKACEVLHLTPQTVSAQIRTLEKVVGDLNLGGVRLAPCCHADLPVGADRFDRVLD